LKGTTVESRGGKTREINREKRGATSLLVKRND